jgi:hypothetical protein
MRIEFITINVGHSKHIEPDLIFHNHKSVNFVVVCLQECATDKKNPNLYEDQFSNWLSGNDGQSKSSCKFELVGEYRTPNLFGVHYILSSKIVKLMVFKNTSMECISHSFEQICMLNLGLPFYYNQIALFSKLQIEYKDASQEDQTKKIQIDIIGVHFHSGSDYENQQEKKCKKCLRDRRISDWDRVMDSYERNEENNGDVCVFLGDTNFRMGFENTKKYLETIKNSHEYKWNERTIAPMVKLEELNENILTLKKKSHGFQEVKPIEFPPTYRVPKNSIDMSELDSERIPAWTDRILFLKKFKLDLKWSGYTSLPNIMHSDHLGVRVIADI